MTCDFNCHWEIDGWVESFSFFTLFCNQRKGNPGGRQSEWLMLIVAKDVLYLLQKQQLIDMMETFDLRYILLRHKYKVFCWRRLASLVQYNTTAEKNDRRILGDFYLALPKLPASFSWLDIMTKHDAQPQVRFASGIIMAHVCNHYRHGSG